MFQYYLSLGFYCAVAESIERLGFRSASGPFDWGMTAFRGVIECIENKFELMFELEDLEVIGDSPAIIYNSKYNFMFNRELGAGESFEDKYLSIKDKYRKKGKRFLDMLSSPCCCIRMIQNEEEISYIKENRDRILEMLKKYNVNNNILYLIHERLENEASCLNPYVIHNLCIDSATRRDLFESNQDLKDYCLKNMDLKSQVRNFSFTVDKQFDIIDRTKRNNAALHN